MRIKEAAQRLGISERMLRHYEKAGLMQASRGDNGYRDYGAADLRRAERIRDLIAVGFSTREVANMSACLSDNAEEPCEDGIPLLSAKLQHIERLRADLDERHAAIVRRLAALQAAMPEPRSGSAPPDPVHGR